MDEELLVTSRTIGTAVHYNMKTSDISRSGMLLSWRHDINKVPFRENTLIEMTIDPNSKLFNSPVSCIGKVVRRIKDEKLKKADVQLGIQIVQIENEDLSEWEHCIDFLMQTAEHLITNNSEFLKQTPTTKLIDEKK
jgi:hypothetical protein